MNILIAAFVAMIVVAAGPATHGTAGSARANGGNSIYVSTDSGDATGDTAQFPAVPMNDTGPKLVVPATGGPPVVGIPVGGDLYIPVTGGPPVVGISVSP